MKRQLCSFHTLSGLLLWWWLCCCCCSGFFPIPTLCGGSLWKPVCPVETVTPTSCRVRFGNSAAAAVNHSRDHLLPLLPPPLCSGHLQRPAWDTNHQFLTCLTCCYCYSDCFKWQWVLFCAWRVCSVWSSSKPSVLSRRGVGFTLSMRLA